MQMNKYTIYTISAAGSPKKLTTIIADSYNTVGAHRIEFYEVVEEPRFARSSLVTERNVATVIVPLERMMIVQDDKKGE